MSVRRLASAEHQPDHFVFTPDNLAWAEAQIKHYPEGRQASAVIPLLWRAHEQCGNWLPKAAIEYVAMLLGMPFIRALEVATFYTMFQLSPVGKKAHVQVCGTTPCMLRGAQELMKVCQHRIHADPFHVSADGDFSWEEVECAGACVNAPMVQIGKDTYEDLTPDLLDKLLDDMAAGKPVKTGPQNGRQFSEPAGGATSLSSTILDCRLRGNDDISGNDDHALTDARAKKPAKPANRREEPAPHADVKNAEATGEQKGG